MSQYNSLESALQIGLIFFYFEDYSKSAREMILFLLQGIPRQKGQKKTTYFCFLKCNLYSENRSRKIISDIFFSKKTERLFGKSLMSFLALS